MGRTDGCPMGGSGYDEIEWLAVGFRAGWDLLVIITCVSGTAAGGCCDVLLRGWRRRSTRSHVQSPGDVEADKDVQRGVNVGFLGRRSDALLSRLGVVHDAVSCACGWR
jgi:hypothetical protein